MKKQLFFLFAGMLLVAFAGNTQVQAQQNRDVVHKTVKYFELKDVRLLDSPFKQAMQLNADWLLELQDTRLASDFYKNAGLTPPAEPYGGWETSGISGHTLGHVLTAFAQQYVATGDQRFKVKGDSLVDMLAVCQDKLGNGFIGGMPGGNKIFEEVKKGEIRSAGFDLNGLWSPWYNIHKTMMGLADMYELTGNKKALDVLVKFSNYLAGVIEPLSDEQMQEMMNCEFGGMNEAFAQVYSFTGNKRFLDAGKKFYHKRVMDGLAEGKDVLPGLHSNTQIPKIIGEARLYELTGDQKDRNIAEYFWNDMTKHHSYANGGNSSGEYLSTGDELNNKLTTSTCETCNTYNMLKLTKHLFEWTGDESYLDYYERALYNHILASQNHETGMTCYFVPLAMGTHKDYSDKDNTFTCCMGTGFENHSKYGGAIYSYSNDKADNLFVNLYIPSVLTWSQRGTKLTLNTLYPQEGTATLTIEAKKAQSYTINLRYPFWAEKRITVKVNGKVWDTATAKPASFIAINRTWKNGDKIEVEIPMTLRTESMPDNADRRAIFYGPTLLAGELGAEDIVAGDIPVFVSSDKQIVNHMKPVGDKPFHFTTTRLGVPVDVTMIPFYNMCDQNYSVYWDVFTPEEWTAKEEQRKLEIARNAELDKRTLDFIRLGEMQQERDHDLTAENSRNGDFLNKKYRYAYPNGYFEFFMKNSYSGASTLLMTFWGGDSDKGAFELVVNDSITYPIVIKGDKNKFAEVTIDLAPEVTKDKKWVKLRFRGANGNRVCNLFDCRLMKKEEK